MGKRRKGDKSTVELGDRTLAELVHMRYPDSDLGQLYLAGKETLFEMLRQCEGNNMHIDPETFFSGREMEARCLGDGSTHHRRGVPHARH